MRWNYYIFYHPFIALIIQTFKDTKTYSQTFERCRWMKWGGRSYNALMISWIPLEKVVIITVVVSLFFFSNLRNWVTFPSFFFRFHNSRRCKAFYQREFAPCSSEWMVHRKRCNFWNTFANGKGKLRRNNKRRVLYCFSLFQFHNFLLQDEYYEHYSFSFKEDSNFVHMMFNTWKLWIELWILFAIVVCFFKNKL